MGLSIEILAVSLTLGALVLTVPSPVRAKNPAGETVKEVDAKFVCMVDKKQFDEPQNPVMIESRTYYVVCRRCAAELIEDPASRMDVDPVSGKEVDKATATVGVDKAGNAYFFENAENLKQFHAPFNPAISASRGVASSDRDCAGVRR
jgi:YHS domain-containing protein